MLSWHWTNAVIGHKTAIFRQINQDNPRTHHDALEFPDGQIVLLNLLEEGQHATVLQFRRSNYRRRMLVLRPRKERPTLEVTGGSSMNELKAGRDFSAWIGLVPKQMSTGDRTILGRISKRGNGYCACSSCKQPGSFCYGR